MKNEYCTRTHGVKIKLRCNIRQMRRNFIFVSQQCDTILKKLFQALLTGIQNTGSFLSEQMSTALDRQQPKLPRALLGLLETDDAATVSWPTRASRGIRHMRRRNSPQRAATVHDTLSRL
jgi:hypothetical protein